MAPKASTRRPRTAQQKAAATARTNNRREKRQEFFDKKQGELKEKRFTSPLIRGMKLGKIENVQYEGNVKADGRRIGAYDGPATVWATLDTNGAIQRREWPDTWGNPGRIHSPRGFEYYAFTDEFVMAELKKKRAECEGLMRAETAGVPYGITRVEAILVEQFRECYDEAVKFCKQIDLITWLPEDTPDKADIQSGRNARIRWDTLRDHYGPNSYRRNPTRDLFPSPEAASITAMWIVSNWDELGKLFTDHPEYIDCALYLGQQKFFRTKGHATQREVIAEVPIAPGQEVFNFTEETLADVKQVAGRVIGDLYELKILAQLSPIANKALRGTPRRPQDAHNAPTDYQRQPLLHNKTARRYDGPQFAAWREVFYNAKGPPYKRVCESPLTVGPHKIITDIENHDDCAQLLTSLADQLADFSHWTLVVTVWSDYLIPAAERDDTAFIETLSQQLLRMIAGDPPHPDDLDMDDERYAGFAPQSPAARNEVLDADESEVEKEEEDEFDEYGLLGP